MKYVTLLRLLVAYLINIKIGVKEMIGAELNVDWSDDGDEEFLYASFSSEPTEDDHFDEFGYPDDEIFYYFENLWEAARLIMSRHHDGWQIKDIRLVYS